MKYKVEMAVAGTVTKIVEANSEEEAREIACEKYGDRDITLCYSCSDKVNELSITGDSDSYEVENI